MYKSSLGNKKQIEKKSSLQLNACVVELRLRSNCLTKASCCEPGKCLSSCWERYVTLDYSSAWNINVSLIINGALRSALTLCHFLFSRRQRKQDACCRANSDYQVNQFSANKPRKNAELSDVSNIIISIWGRMGAEKAFSNNVISCKWSKTLNDVGVECMLAHMIIPL